MEIYNYCITVENILPQCFQKTPPEDTSKCVCLLKWLQEENNKNSIPTSQPVLLPTIDTSHLDN